MLCQNDYDQMQIHIKKIIDKGASILYDNYLTQKIPTYNAEDLLTFVNGVLEEQLIQQQKQESKYSYVNQWSEDIEPKLKGYDSLAALAIKSNYNPKLNVKVIEEDEDDSKSKRSLRSMKSLKSKNSSAVSQQRLSRKSINFNPSPIQNNLSRFKEEKEKMPELVKMPDEQPKFFDDDPLIDKLRDDRERITRERNREQERLRKIAQQDAETEQRIKEQLKQLKNQDFTYDIHGNLVMIQKQEDTGAHKDVIVDVKYKEPSKITKPVTNQPEIKNLKDWNERKKLDQAIVQEFPKQPNLVEILQPKQGINIKFETGMIKEGQKFAKQNKLTRDDYDKLLEQAGGNINRQQKKAKKSQEVVQHQQKIGEISMDESVNIQNGSKVQIVKVENDALKAYMLKLEKDESSHDKNKVMPVRINNIQKKQKIKIDQILNYNQELEQALDVTQQKGKLHQVVDDFNKKLMENGMWGVNEEQNESKAKVVSYKTLHDFHKVKESGHPSRKLQKSETTKLILPRLK